MFGKATIEYTVSRGNALFKEKTKFEQEETKLRLSNQSIISIDLRQLVGTFMVRSLNLSANILDNVNLEPLSLCPGLQILDVSKNRLRSLDLTPLRVCSDLRALNAADNSLQTLDLGPLSGCSDLRRVSLEGNDLQTLDLGPLSGCLALEEIGLSGNCLRSLDLEPLRGCRRLTRLLFDYNQLQSLDLEPLGGIASLQQICFDNNQIRNVDLRPLGHCSGLEELDISSNEMQNLDISPLIACSKMATLRVDAFDPKPFLAVKSMPPVLADFLKSMKSSLPSFPPHWLENDTTSSGVAAQASDSSQRWKWKLEHRLPIVSVAWSSDSRHIAFSTGMEFPGSRVVRRRGYVIDRPRGRTKADEYELTRTGEIGVWEPTSGSILLAQGFTIAYGIHWSLDGKSLTYLNGRSLVTRQVDTGNEKIVRLSQPVTVPISHYAVRRRTSLNQPDEYDWEYGLFVTDEKSVESLGARYGLYYYPASAALCNPVSVVSWETNGQKAAVLYYLSHIEVHNTTDHSTTTLTYQTSDGRILMRGMALSADGRYIAASSSSKVRVWETSSGRLLLTIPIPGKRTRGAALKWSPVGRYLAAALNGDHTGVLVIDTAKGARGATIRTQSLLDFCWSPDGLFIAVCSPTGVSFWDVRKRKEVDALKEIKDVLRVSWSPDGKWLATASGITSHTIHVWNVRDVAPAPTYVIEPSPASTYSGSEQELEDVLEKDPTLLGPGYSLMGRQHPAGEGRIDLLLKASDGALVVVELKRDEADDITVGQILRYLTFIEEQSPSNAPPRGIIVASNFTSNLKAAVRASRFKIHLIPASMVWDNLQASER